MGRIGHIDLGTLDATGLGDWLEAPSGAPTGGGHVSTLWPSGTKVTDVLRIVHDDGHYASAIDKSVMVDQVKGIGTDHLEIVDECFQTKSVSDLFGYRKPTDSRSSS